jgi:hypothetical protein
MPRFWQFCSDACTLGVPSFGVIFFVLCAAFSANGIHFQLISIRNCICINVLRYTSSDFLASFLSHCALCSYLLHHNRPIFNFIYCCVSFALSELHEIPRASTMFALYVYALWLVILTQIMQIRFIFLEWFSCLAERVARFIISSICNTSACGKFAVGKNVREFMSPHYSSTNYK